MQEASGGRIVQVSERCILHETVEKGEVEKTELCTNDHIPRVLSVEEVITKGSSFQLVTEVSKNVVTCSEGPRDVKSITNSCFKVELDHLTCHVKYTVHDAI